MRASWERGAATIVVAAVAAVTMLLALVLTDVGLYLRARATAATAADAAALAAAPVTFASFGATVGPADEAARFAAANGARLASCDCAIDRSWAPRIVRVVVTVPVDLLMFGHHDVPASSQAEFQPTAMADPWVRAQPEGAAPP